MDGNGTFDAAVDHAVSMLAYAEPEEVREALLSHRRFGEWLRSTGTLSSVMAEAAAKRRDVEED